MSDPPRDDKQEIHVHIEDRGRGAPRDDYVAEEEAAAASAMSAQLIWIILVVVLVVAVVLLFTSGVIDIGGADDVVDEIVPTQSP